MDLAEIAAKYPDTDKPTAGDGHYLNRYQSHFEPVRNSVRRILEIGVRGGGSLRMWRDYFPNARVFGVDIDPACRICDERFIHTIIGDVQKPDILTAASVCGPFDIIIDDGSHKAKDIIDAVVGLYSALAPGGLYCIEDLGTQAMPEYRDYRSDDCNALDFLHDGVVAINGGRTQPKFSAFHFYPHLVIMRK